MLVDRPLERLREYRPERDEPAGFDEFRARTLGEARASAEITVRPSNGHEGGAAFHHLAQLRHLAALLGKD